MSEQIIPYKSGVHLRYAVDNSFTDERGIFHRLRRRGFDTEKAARQWSRRAELAAREGIPQERRKRPSSASEANPETWSTNQVWEAVLGLIRERLKETTVRHLISVYGVHVEPRIGKRVFAKLTPRDMEQLASDTYAVSAVRCLLKWAPRAGAVLPAAKFDPPKRKESRRLIWMEPDEAKRALDLLPEKFKPMFLICLGTGARLGELAGFQWRDFDEKRGLVTIARQVTLHGKTSTPKSGKSRIIPLTATTARGLAMLRRGSGEDFLFKGLRHKFAGAMRDLQAPLGKAVTCHSIRHTTATWMVLAGVPLPHVAKTLGHGTMAVTELYSHLQPHHLVDGASAVDAAFSP